MTPTNIGNQIEKAVVCGTKIFSVRSEKSDGLRALSKKIPKEENTQINGDAINIAA
jgi:hypothetical protein